MSLKQKATAGMVWTFLQQGSSQIINFVVSIILARLLEPSDFGTIAIFGVFLAIGQTLIDSGLSNSLIRTSDADNRDFSTVFFFNLIISTIIFLIFFFSSPWIARYFEMPILVDVIRVYSITLVIGAFASVQSTLFTKRLDFKTPFLIRMPSAIISAVVGVVMAYLGYGVWSLVGISISGSIVSTIMLWYYSPWKPKFVFNNEKFKSHFSFGYKLTLSALINTLFANIYTIVIGKQFNSMTLGYYNKANSYSMMPVNFISGPLNKVTYPLFAEIKDDNVRLKQVYKKLMKTVIFIISPVLALMTALAEPLFSFVITDKWLPAVPFFQLTCITALLYPVHAYNLNILLVKGRSDLFLRLEIIKKILTIIVLSTSVRFGIYAILIGQIFSSIISLGINCYYSGKFLQYNVFSQLKDISLPILFGLVIGVSMYMNDQYILVNHHDFIRLIISSCLGVTIFGILSYTFKIEELSYAKELLLMAKEKIQKKNG